jgi:hypothetical protein
MHQANGTLDALNGRSVENMLVAVRRVVDENGQYLQRELADLKAAQQSFTNLTDTVKEMLRLMARTEAHLIQVGDKILAATEKLAGPQRTVTTIERDENGEMIRTESVRVYEGT